MYVPRSFQTFPNIMVFPVSYEYKQVFSEYPHSKSFVQTKHFVSKIP